MHYEIRKATINDLKTIQDFNYELFKKENGYDNSLNINWPYEDGKEYFMSEINNQFVYVALDNNVIIGYLDGAIRKPFPVFKSKRAILENMIVDERYRNKGIGTILINHFKKWCQENDVEEIIVDIYAANNQGINFYKNNGFDNYQVQLRNKLDDLN